MFILMLATKRLGAIKSGGSNVTCAWTHQHGAFLKTTTPVREVRIQSQSVPPSCADDKSSQTAAIDRSGPTFLAKEVDLPIRRYHAQVVFPKKIPSLHEFIVPPKPEQQGEIKVSSSSFDPSNFLPIFTSHLYPDFCYVCQC